MKKLFAILVAVLLATNVLAQAPQKMSYQAVIRDVSNNLVTNQSVGMRISILQGATPVYVETHATTTNTNGLISIEIGGGSIVSGSFASINWGMGTYNIKTETDPTGGTNYTAIVSTNQLLSVPYAFYASSSGDTVIWNKNGSNISYNNGDVGVGTVSPSEKLEVYDGNIIISNDANPATLILKGDRSNSSDGLVQVDSRIDFLNDGGNVDGVRINVFNDASKTHFGIQEISGGIYYDRFYIQGSTGNIGIGTITPARTLHVNAVMRLEPIPTAPTSPAKGDMYFDSTLNKLRVYDGTTWQNCW